MGACDEHSVIPAPFDVYRDVVRPEWIDHDVSGETGRGSPMAPAIGERLARIQAAHAALARPAQVGRRIGLGAPPTTRG